MQLLPADLGVSGNLSLLEARASAMSSQNTGFARRGRLLRSVGSGPDASLNPLTRWWTGGLNLSDKGRKEVLGKARSMTLGLSLGFGFGGIGFLMPAILVAAQGEPGVATALFALYAAFASVGLITPKLMIKQWQTRPVTVAEVETLLAGSEDDLERAFLLLARDALRQEGIDGKAADDLRAAIQALGNALDRLPPLGVGGETDAAKLRAEAEALLVQAKTEADAVIAGSLTRRAETLGHSARTAERSTLLLRRTAALREELRAQIDGLRLEIASLYTGGGAAEAAQSTGDLSGVADKVRAVALEAAAVADARSELDDSVLRVGGR